MSTKYENVRLECADNGGFILCYEEVSQPEGEGHLCNRDYKYKKEVFDSQDKEMAVKRLLEMSGKKETMKVEIEMPIKGDD